jgi:cytochrome c biogenesis protein CcdA/thiol-disulfide isomerase/thioredoxin
MILFVLAYLGGVLTILSPCILPVLPFVFARADQPFLKRGLPLLLGMAATFALIATLAAVGGGWAVQANQYGRAAALALLALFGLTLLFPALSDRLTQPLVALGARLSRSSDQGGSGGILPSLLLGIATGLLWAPCAGPILGLILTGAALQGASVHTTVLLLAYAAGAATSLAVALLIGGRVFAAMKRSLGTGEWVRRGLGAAVLVAVGAISLGLDTGFLTNVSLASTASLEQGLVDALHPAPAAKKSSVVMTGGPAMMMMQGAPKMAADTLPVEGTLPSLSGAVTWLNSPPLTAQSLKGKVVLVDFWTYSCINCLRALPYVRAWAEKYKDQGLVVIGVHAPEFAFEKNIDNVKRAVADLKIDYPVAIDDNYAIWRAFNNEYWPAHYFIDAEGRIRHHHFGEGDYDGSERVIQQLLAEAGRSHVAGGLVAVKASGVEAAADMDDIQSPETYIGYERAENFVSPGGAVHDASHVYAAGTPQLNQWGLDGAWTIGGESALLDRQAGAITYRFHARDLHLVLGPGPSGKPVRFRVTVDGAAPGPNHGTDTDAAGQGVVTEQRLYQLVRQSGPVADHTLEIQFLDPGVEAYSFTFG